MVDYWNDRPVAGLKEQVPVTLINDQYEPWNGPVTLRVKRGHRVLVDKTSSSDRSARHDEPRFRPCLAGIGRSVRSRSGVCAARTASWCKRRDSIFPSTEEPMKSTGKRGWTMEDSRWRRDHGVARLDELVRSFAV